MKWTRRAMILTAAAGLTAASAQFAAHRIEVGRSANAGPADCAAGAFTTGFAATGECAPDAGAMNSDGIRGARTAALSVVPALARVDQEAARPAMSESLSAHSGLRIPPEALVSLLSVEGMQFLAMAEPADAPTSKPDDAPATRPSDDRGPGRRWRDRDRDREDGDRDGPPPPPRRDGGFDPGGPGGPGGFGGQGGGPGGPGMGPQGDGPRGPGGGMRRGPGGMRPAFPGSGLPPIDASDPSEDEWERIANFWRQNSPARWAQYERLEADASADDAPPRLEQFHSMARRRMAMRHRMIEQLREHKQAKLADLSVDALRAEDEAFDSFQKARAAAASGADEQAARQAFKHAVGKFVDASFAERAERTEMLRQVIRREEERLQKDRDGRDEIIKRQSERFEREFGMMGTPRQDGPATRPADDR